jgi:quinol monooxygenase YgiN
MAAWCWSRGQSRNEAGRAGTPPDNAEEEEVNPECILIATLDAKPEKRAELLEILHGFVRPTRKEDGCVAYHLHVSDDDPNRFVFYEVWETRKHLDDHLKMPYLESFWNKRLDLLTKDVDLHFVNMLSDMPEGGAQSRT